MARRRSLAEVERGHNERESIYSHPLSWREIRLKKTASMGFRDLVDGTFHLGNGALFLGWEREAGVLSFGNVGYQHQANLLAVDEHDYVDYDYEHYHRFGRGEKQLAS
jgi:hypothetical protein